LRPARWAASSAIRSAPRIFRGRLPSTISPPTSAAQSREADRERRSGHCAAASRSMNGSRLTPRRRGRSNGTKNSPYGISNRTQPWEVAWDCRRGICGSDAKEDGKLARHSKSAEETAGVSSIDIEAPPTSWLWHRNAGPSHRPQGRGNSTSQQERFGRHQARSAHRTSWKFTVGTRCHVAAESIALQMEKRVAFAARCARR